MLSLIKFEFMKLAKKRTNIITILVSFIITIIFFSMPTIQFVAYDTNGERYTGLNAIELEKRNIKEISDILTEEKITNDIKEYQRLFSMPENITENQSGEISFKEDIYWSYLVPKLKYLEMIAGNYDKPYEYSWINKLPTISLDNGAEFYKTRNNKIDTILNMEYDGGNYSDQEKNFWINKSAEVQEPYRYGYHEGWNTIISALELLIFCILAICITIAPCFAGEYQCGADAIILSAKYGKSKVITAKIISAFTFSTLVFWGNAIIAVAIPLLTFGIDGWDLPMQINNTIMPYSITFASGVLICLCISYLVMLGLVSFTLLLSAKLKTAFSVLIIDVIILFIPLFLKVSNNNGLTDHILYLSPYKSLQEEFSSYLSYSIGRVTISLIAMRIWVYSIITIVFLPFVKRAFCKHQVQ